MQDSLRLASPVKEGSRAQVGKGTCVMILHRKRLGRRVMNRRLFALLHSTSLTRIKRLHRGPYSEGSSSTEAVVVVERQ